MFRHTLFILIALCGQASFLLGQAEFSTTTPLPTQTGLLCASLGDLDGDGLADYAVADKTEVSALGEFGVVRVVSSATGTVLATHRGLNVPEQFAANIHSADFDGDGSLDLVIAIAAGLTPRLHVVNPLTGGLIVSILPATGSVFDFGVSIDSRDIDGDGKAELLVSGTDITNPSGPFLGTVFLFDGGTGTQSKSVNNPAVQGFGETALFLDDVNGDSMPEILVTSESALHPSGLYPAGFQAVIDLNSGATFHQAQETGGMRYAKGGVVLEDIDLDGVRDYALASRSSMIPNKYTTFSGASGTIISQTSRIGPFFAWHATMVKTNDLDGDGLSDLAMLDTPVALGTQPSHVSIYSSATLTQIDRLDVSNNAALAFTDMAVLPDQNGDGFQELIFGNYLSLTTPGAVQVSALAPSLSPLAKGNHPSGAELLAINGSTGLFARRIDVAMNQPFSLSFLNDHLVSGPTEFLIFGMIGIPSTATRYATSFGDFVFPPRIAIPLFPWLFTVADSANIDPMAFYQPTAAPFAIGAPFGIPTAIDLTFQGVSFDGAGTAIHISNAILLRVR